MQIIIEVVQRVNHFINLSNECFVVAVAAATSTYRINYVLCLIIVGYYTRETGACLLNILTDDKKRNIVNAH